MININDFFCEYDVREFCRTPFTLNGKTVATNGHLFIEHDNYMQFPKAPANVADIMQNCALQYIGIKPFKPLPVLKTRFDGIYDRAVFDWVEIDINYYDLILTEPATKIHLLPGKRFLVFKGKNYRGIIAGMFHENEK